MPGCGCLDVRARHRVANCTHDWITLLLRALAFQSAYSEKLEQLLARPHPHVAVTHAQQGNRRQQQQAGILRAALAFHSNPCDAEEAEAGRHVQAGRVCVSACVCVREARERPRANKPPQKNDKPKESPLGSTACAALSTDWITAGAGARTRRGPRQGPPQAEHLGTALCFPEQLAESLDSAPGCSGSCTVRSISKGRQHNHR